MIYIVVFYFVYTLLVGIYFIGFFKFTTSKMNVFDSRFKVDEVFKILKLDTDMKDLDVRIKPLKNRSVIELFLNSRYNPFNKTIVIFSIDDSAFDIVTLNVAIHEFSHYLLEKNQTKKINQFNSLNILNLLTKMIVMPLVIILLLTLVMQIIKFGFLSDAIFMFSSIIIVAYFVIFYGFTSIPLEYNVAKLSLKTVINMKILEPKAIKLYKKLNTLSLIGHIIVQILIVLLFVMIYIAYLFFKNKYMI